MQVVYTPAHLAHDITTETFMGLSIPANEVAERAEKIRDALTADGGFAFVEPTDHGEAPITAVHEPGLVRFLEIAWSEVRRQGIARPFLSADTYPNISMFEGMSEDAIAALVREPVHAGGRAGYWGLDSAAPLVAGTYLAARGAVDVAMTAADLVVAGALDVRRLLLLQQRSHRGRGDRPRDPRARRDPRYRLPPRQRQPADLLETRRGPLRLDPRRPRQRLSVLPWPRRRDRRGRWGRGEPEHPAR